MATWFLRFFSASNSVIVNRVSSRIILVPLVQRRLPMPRLAEIAARYTTHDDAIVVTYVTGAYSYREIAEHYNIHLATVERIIKKGDATIRELTPCLLSKDDDRFARNELDTGNLLAVERIGHRAPASANPVHEPLAVKGRNVGAPAGADDAESFLFH